MNLKIIINECNRKFFLQNAVKEQGSSRRTAIPKLKPALNVRWAVNTIIRPLQRLEKPCAHCTDGCLNAKGWS